MIGCKPTMHVAYRYEATSDGGGLQPVRPTTFRGECTCGWLTFVEHDAGKAFRNIVEHVLGKP